MNLKVGSLSGGQRQAMALLMTIMTPIDFLILDEHTAALDPKTATQIMSLTEKIVAENQLTCLMITHRMEDALKYGNRMIVLEQGQVKYDINKEEKEKLEMSDLLSFFN